ncbi:MAG: hypothetical protein AAGC57_11830 [Pseudomonadota bacterium]
MRTLVLLLMIPTTAVLAAGLWGLALMKGDVGAFVATLERGEFPAWPEMGGFGPVATAPRTGADGNSAISDATLALMVEQHIGRASLGAGDRGSDVTIERADASEAVIALPTGQRVTITAPEGFDLYPRFSEASDDGHVGVLLMHPETPIGFSVGDVEALRSAKLAEKMQFYEALSQQIATKSSSEASIDEVRFDARGLIYCLRPRWSGDSALMGARVDRGLIVQAVLRTGCGEASDLDVSRLDIAVRSVTPERWR